MLWNGMLVRTIYKIWYSESRNRCCSLQSMRYDSPYFDRFHQHRKGEREMKNWSRIKESYDGGFAEMYLDLYKFEYGFVIKGISYI